MGVVRMLASIDLRRRWGSALVLALLTGVVGAVVLASVAGARRTASSLERFEEESRAAHLEVNVGDASAEQIERLRAHPAVEGIGVLRQVALFTANEHVFLPSAGPVDGSFGRDVDRARLVEGRWARGVHELNVGEGLAGRLGVGLGDSIRFVSFSPEQVASESDEAPVPAGPAVTFDVVGIVRRPLDLGARGEAGGVIVPTKEFMQRYGDDIGSFSGKVLRIRLVDPDDAVAVQEAARRIFGASPFYQAAGVGVEGQGARSAVDVAEVSLWALAGVTALAGAGALAIALARHMAAGVEVQPTYRALGMRGSQRWAATVAQAIPVAVGGAVLAVVFAVAASALFPIGVARDADPDPGLRFDVAVLGLGLVATVIAVLLISAAAAVPASRARRRVSSRPGVSSEALARSGFPPPIATGVGFALERGAARGGVPVRAALAGATLGVVGIVAAFTFGANLHHLVTTPASYGWTWDFALTGGTVDGDDPCASVRSITREQAISAAANLCYGDVLVAGHPTNGYAIERIEGDIAPEIVAGRAPGTPREVALGAKTLESTSLEVGDDVVVRAGRGPARFRIVGEVVLPGIDDPGPLADTALFTRRGLDRARATDDGYLLVRLHPGVDVDAAARRLAEYSDEYGAVFPQLPAEIDHLLQVEFLPRLLAAFVAVVALAAVGHASVVVVRRRRHDLAILKTIGFVNRQVRATLAWQATTFGVIGLVVGSLLGIVVGRVAWSLAADSLGVSGTASTPVVVLVVLVPVVLLVVNAVALVPARTAARTRPAVVLRSE
jgi:hypothetical protein